MPFRDALDCEEHFQDHGTLLNIATVQDYEHAADQFMHGILCNTCYECHRPQGGRVRFDAVSSRYGVVTTYGHIATFMIVESINHHYPTNWEYYISRCN